jgi:hypothetical protein
LVYKVAQQMAGDHLYRLRPTRDPRAREQWRRVAEGFRGRFSKLADLMDEAEEKVLGYVQPRWQPGARRNLVPDRHHASAVLSRSQVA